MSTEQVQNLLRLGAFIEAVSSEGVDVSIAAPSEDGEKWSVALVWGREAKDSPMAGAAAYGLGDTLAEALDVALKEAGY